MAVSSRDYRDIDRERFEELKGKLRAAGITPPEGDRGTLQGPHRILFEGAYDETKKTLTLTILKKPMLVPEPMIWQAVDGAIGTA